MKSPLLTLALLFILPALRLSAQEENPALLADPAPSALDVPPLPELNKEKSKKPAPSLMPEGIDPVGKTDKAKPGWLPPLRVMYAWTATSAVVFCAANWYFLSSRRAPSGPGRYVFEHSRPDDRIFVWGQSSQVYLDAERRPASRYIATFPLTGYIFGGPLPGVDTRSRILPGAWDTLQRDFAAHPPAFIVDTEIRPGALYPIADSPILAAIVRDQFELVQTTTDGTVYRRRAQR